MTSDEIIGSYGLPVIHEPMPKEIERGLMDAERRLRAQAFREIADAAAAWLGRVFRGREVQPAHSDNAATPAPMA